MALTPTDSTPWVHVNNRQLLHPAGCKGVVKVVSEAGRLGPGIFGIPKEHAQQVSSARLPIGALVCFSSMHDAQVVDELDIALLAIKLCAELLCQVLDNMHGVHVLICDFRHARVSLDAWASKERCLDELADGLASRKEEGWARLEVWRLIPDLW